MSMNLPVYPAPACRPYLGLNLPEFTALRGEWREGVGVEPTRDVYSPIPDLKSGGITGCLTLPWVER